MSEKKLSSFVVGSSFVWVENVDNQIAFPC